MSRDKIEWSWIPDSTDWPITVSYFTNAFYQRDAFELARSCRMFQLPYLIQEVPDLGGWRENTNHKPTWLMQIHERLPDRPIVWLDADGRFRQLPSLLLILHEGIAYHTWAGRKPASGTVWFGSNGRLDLLEEWEREVRQYPKDTDQVCLGRVVDHLEIPHTELPESYCWVFDVEGCDLAILPVVEHMQASRWTHRRVPAIRSSRLNRDPVPKGKNKHRRNG